MSRVRSIETMRVGLADAVAQSDWSRARRYVERLKGIVIDAVVQDDPFAIRLAGHALQQSGERLELVADLPMVFDKVALAWQMRADASTAALAARVRPSRVETGAPDEVGDVPELLLRALRRSNAPMSNSDLAASTGKDPATVSRTMKRLERDGWIRRWRANGRQLNTPVRNGVRSDEQLNALRFTYRQSVETEALKATYVQSAVFASAKKEVLVNFASGKTAVDCIDRF